MEREKIIKKSSEMFYSIGFKTVTMDDVANELAMSKKTLYELFRSKESLIEEVLTYKFQLIEDYFAKLQEQKLTAIEELLLLREYITKKFGSVQQQNSMYQLQKYYGELFRKIYLLQNKAIVKRIEINFSKGKEQGVYRKKVQPEVCASLFVETQNSIKQNPIFNNDSIDVQALCTVHSGIFLRGIVTAKGLEKLEKLTQN